MPKVPAGTGGLLADRVYKASSRLMGVCLLPLLHVPFQSRPKSAYANSVPSPRTSCRNPEATTDNTRSAVTWWQPAYKRSVRQYHSQTTKAGQRNAEHAAVSRPYEVVVSPRMHSCPNMTCTPTTKNSQAGFSGPAFAPTYMYLRRVILSRPSRLLLLSSLSFYDIAQMGGVFRLTEPPG